MSELSSLLSQVAHDPAIDAAMRGMSVPGTGTIVAPPGLRPPIIALADDDSLTVVITATGRRANQLGEAISAWGPRAAVFPSWETLPHERLSPGLDTMARRAAVLRRLAHPIVGDEHAGPIDVLIVPVRALLQPVAADVAEMEPLRVKVGDWIDRDDLLARLFNLGYSPVDTVRGRGEVSVHGGIVDVFPPAGDHPVRLELFGDEVEEIRWFNLSDQRSAGPAEGGLWAPAARELVLTDEVRQRARELQRELPGAADILELASEGIYAPGIESLTSALVSQMRSLDSLIPTDALWCVDEPERVLRRAEDLATTSSEFESAAWGAAAGGGNAPLTMGTGSFLALDEVWAPEGSRWWELTSLQGAEVLDEAETRYFRTQARDVIPYRADFRQAAQDLAELAALGWTLVLTTPGHGAARRLTQLLLDAEVPARLEEELPLDPQLGLVHVVPVAAGVGFVMEESKLAVFTEQDLTGGRSGGTTRDMRKMPARRKGKLDPLSLRPGDFIVHEQHGIGRFLEMESRVVPGTNAKRDYLVVEYAGARGRPADVLYVPTSSLDQVSKYTGSDEPRLSRMGGADWAKTKKRAKAAVKEIAAELVRLYAARQSMKGHAFSPDTPWQRELEDSFPYVETPDQLLTIDEVKADMERDVPMDRLLTGDVGYGKTEIAVRAAFKAVQDGKQVAVLVPTTLLVQQHVDTFTERFAGFPINIGALSRFSTKKEADEVRQGLLDGTIDVVIGTHSLLTGSVRFKDLGLVVIDEEQRFGVEHKETLKALRAQVDVLAMSATPIPRTLEMAVAGIREMSVLQTPPEERQPVLTFVGPYQNAQVAAAIRRELMRDGQVFFIHNRVETINKVAAELQELVPEARIRVAHGKLSEGELERVIVDFWNHEFDVLVCTTIVETGLDISNANTLIVDRADIFGLSQLHQLRGRVGRGRERAYAYFFYPKGKTLTETALERLRTIAANSDLGSGLAVAQKDLEIRGAGNLLGGAQSGHIEGVGFDLYVRMVADAVAEYKGEKPQETTEVRIELPVDAHLPESYIPGEDARLEVYGKIAQVNDPALMREVQEELLDRYGPLPSQVERLFLLARLRSMLRQLGITEVVTQGRYVRLGPVELADSQALRLKRLYPGSVIKAATRQILVPLTRHHGETGPEDEAILSFVEDLLRGVIVGRGKSRG
ncbi:transcription-repair coupling factor [Actinomycetaceae bacterium WB03_NA08]|uniref:Transcription-repair-coupling factor n=1 Tax=Scrofimicrobium canadense TaxID=2652290 RepID=A0A6N7VVT9_9ACTO|nr:transcription-repair coupling factor [Scrofimicrobium canadense]MSS85100.1 transcription-repair coupling factor [Scrofimicrobium canadense]